MYSWMSWHTVYGFWCALWIHSCQRSVCVCAYLRQCVCTCMEFERQRQFPVHPTFHCQLSCFAYIALLCFALLQCSPPTAYPLSASASKSLVPRQVKYHGLFAVTTNWSQCEWNVYARSLVYYSYDAYAYWLHHRRARNGMLSLSWVVESNAWHLLDALDQHSFLTV